MRFSPLLPILAALSSACSSSPDFAKCQVGARSAGPAGCTSVAVDGDPNACGFSGTGAQPQSVCDRFCGGDAGIFSCSFNGDSSSPSVTCAPGSQCTGRRPRGFRCTPGLRVTLATALAELAELEDASVDAFAILAEELARFGAPGDLVRGVRRAMRDEIRHARAMSALARSFGGDPKRPIIPPPARRTIFEVALENAVEGCVRETYGAAVGAWQARHAQDGRVRRAFAIVAADEARHADLAWDVHAWAMSRLEPAERVAIGTAMEGAIADLEGSLANAPTALAPLGLPSVSEARAMLGVLREHLWTRREAA